MIDDNELFSYLYNFIYAISKNKKLGGLLPHYLNGLLRITIHALDQNSALVSSKLRDLVRLFEHLPENSKKHCPFLITSLVGTKVRSDLKKYWKDIMMKLLDTCDDHGRAAIMTIDHYRPLLKSLWKDYEHEFKYTGKS